MNPRVLRNVQLPDRQYLTDVEVIEQHITRISHDIQPVDHALEMDLHGALLFPGFVETHIHLDKACLLTSSMSPHASLQDAIAKVSIAKKNFTENDVYERGRKTLERCIVNGTNRIRTHVEVDPRARLVSFDAIRQLKRDFEWALDLQICVFPQEGLTNDPGAEQLLHDALVSGADVLGGCPYTDTDPKEQIRRLFSMAIEFNVDLDFHLDFDLDSSWNHIDEVIRQTHTHARQGRVCVGHMSKLSMLPPEQLDTLAGSLADADIAVTVLPSTDLYLMGRDYTHAIPRGVAPVHILKAHGVRCSISTNNYLNPFTPYGDASLSRMANLYANVAQIGDEQSLFDCFQMISNDAAQITGMQATIDIGQEATFVAMDSGSEAETIATIAAPLWGMKRGLKTFDRPRPSLSSDQFAG